MAGRASRRPVTVARFPCVMLVVDPRARGVLEALDGLRVRLPGERVLVQLRMKEASDAERIAASRELAAVSPIGAALVVNESIATARAIAADGVHLPEASASVADARRALIEGALVGASCHDAAGVERRSGEGADYLVLGPLGDVPGKPSMTAAGFEAAVALARAPVFALGGIVTADEVRRARDLGATGVAIQRGLRGGGALSLLEAALAAFDG